MQMRDGFGCPWCGSTQIVPVYDDAAPKGGRWAMYCRSGCGAKGPDADSKADALLMWSTVTEKVAFDG